jgi:acyl carrier protein
VDFPEFRTLFREEFVDDGRRFDDRSRLVDDLGFDSIELSRLAMLLEDVCPGFQFPEDVDLREVCVEDVFYFLELHIQRNRPGET